MPSLDRRDFLKTAVVGLASHPMTQRTAPENIEDPLGVRSEFPVTKSQIYLNSAYVGPIPRVVRQAAVDFADERMLRPSPGRRHEIRERARRRFADLFGVKSKEVAFLYSTSDGENIVARGLDLRAGDNVVIDELQFTTSFVLYRELERNRGIELRIVPQKEGRARSEDFEERIDRRTRLVSVAWVSNRNGFRHDVRALSGIAHAHGALFYADAIQALGAVDTRLRREGFDFAAGNAYKWLFAGFGVAPFFIREEHLDRIRPDRYGHGQVVEPLADFRYRLQTTADKFEYANLAYGPLCQLDASLEFIKKIGLSRIEQHGTTLAKELREGVVKLGFKTLTPPGNRSQIVSFTHGREPERVASLFEKEGIVVSLRERGTEVRAAVAMFNNRSDIRRFLEALGEIA